MAKDILKQAKKCLAICVEASQDNRDRFESDIKFGRLSQQWDEEDKKVRKGRPCLTINGLPSYIRQVVNDARQNKPQIKVHPVDSGADVKTAKIINGLIRNIEATSRADIAYDTAIDHAASGGFGYIRVDLDYARNDSFDLDIIINRIANPLTVYEDPYSTAADGSDWNECFVTEMLEEDDFLRKYPNAEKINFDGLDEDDSHWFTDKSIRVAEYWVRTEEDTVLLLLSNGDVVKQEAYEQNKDLFDVSGVTISRERPTKTYKVKQYILNGKEILEENDWPGMYIPIIPVYGEEVNENGKRHLFSLIHHAIDAQKTKNYWRSAATEAVALTPKAPYIGPKGAFKSDAGWNTANTENHPYLEFDGNIAPQRQPYAGVSAGALQEALNANDDIKAILGMFDPSLGINKGNQSGKAINALQREGDVGTFHFIDNLTRSIRQLGAVVLDLIPHAYNKERIVRVLGEDGTPTNIPINQKVMVDEKGMPVPPEKQQQMPGIEHIFDLSKGKYDLTVTSGPAFTTLRQESAVQMTEFIRSFPEAAPIIGDLLAKAQDWAYSDEIADRLKEINPVLQKKEQAGKPPQPTPEMLQLQAETAKIAEENKGKVIEGELDKQKGQLQLALKAQDIEKLKVQIGGELAKEHQSDSMATQVREGDKSTLQDFAVSIASLISQTVGKVLIEQNATIATSMNGVAQALALNAAPKMVTAKRGPDGNLTAEVRPAI